MFRLIKEEFIPLLSFRISLATKCVSLSGKPCIAKPTFFYLKHVELNSYPFLISLDKCNGRCNAVDDLSTKICVLSQTKAINVKVFNMITTINKAKKLIIHILCDFKCSINSTTFNSNLKMK